jgi:serine/threonine protein kinase
MEKKLFVLMEYCSGGDLTQTINNHLQDKKHIPEDTVRRYLTQLMSALEYCRKANVLHRDLKPSNSEQKNLLCIDIKSSNGQQFYLMLAIMSKLRILAFLL